MDYKSTNLMEIGKLSLVREDWSWGSVLQFEHTEYMPAPYTNEEVESEIDIEQAKQLIVHLQKFIDESEKA